MTPPAKTKLLSDALHEPSAHETLHGGPWDEERVRAAVRKVVAETERMRDPTGRWPLHPLDAEGKDDDWAGVSHGIYLGAAGMLWALDHLTRAGAAETSIDLAAAAARLHAGYLQRCHAPDEPMPSLWVGEAGVLLKIQPTHCRIGHAEDRATRQRQSRTNCACDSRCRK